jgi:transposase
MCTMPKEFREDVIRGLKTSDSSIAQVAKDFGISPSALTIDDRNSAHPSPAAQAANE